MNHGFAEGAAGKMMAASSPTVTCLCNTVLEETDLTLSFERADYPLLCFFSIQGCHYSLMALRGSWVWCRTWIRAESTIQMENCKKVPQRLECSLPMVLVCSLSSSPLLYLTLSPLHLAGIPHWGSAWLCFPLEFPLSWDPGLHNGAVCPSRFTSLPQALQ